LRLSLTEEQPDRNDVPALINGHWRIDLSRFDSLRPEARHSWSAGRRLHPRGVAGPHPNLAEIEGSSPTGPARPARAGVI